MWPVAGLLLVMAGCGGPRPTPVSSPGVSASSAGVVTAGASSSGMTPPGSSVAASALPSLSGTPQDSQLPVPSTDLATLDADRSQACGIAARAVAAFARPGLSAQEWMAGLAPFLSEQAMSDYAGTDPANVPATRVTGPVRVMPQPSDRLAGCGVPTDAGEYQVLLSRLPERPDWRVERITLTR